MKRIRLLFYIASVAVFLGSCTGKDGAPGATGPAGTSGTNGTNGVANMSLQIDTISTSSWALVSGYYQVNYSVPALTNVTTDGIEAFISSNAGQWLCLPASHLLVNGDEMVPVFSNGAMRLVYLYSSAPTVTLIMKIVVIPPAVMKSHPNTNWKNYNEVSAIMNL